MYGDVRLTVYKRRRGVHLAYIESSRHGKGKASNALAMLLEICDECDVEVTVIPLQVYEGLTTDQLIEWYKRHGFTEQLGTREMKRLPHAL